MTYFFEDDKTIGLNTKAVITTNTSVQTTPSTGNNYVTINLSLIHI